MRLLLYLLYPDNNQFENGNIKASRPTDLTKAQTFYIYKSSKVIMISKNKNMIFAAFWVEFLYLKCFNNG